MAHPRIRSWVFTLNNYTEENVAELKALEAAGKVVYVCFGREVAPTTGTPHLQGGAHFKNGKTLAAVKGLGSPFASMALFPMKGTWAQTRTYCSKESALEEFGVCPKQGKRSDLAEARSAVEDGLSLGDAIRDGRVTSWQGLRGFASLERALAPPPKRLREMRCIWLWGGTGLGKTVFANHVLESLGFGEPYHVTSVTDRFWMGYTHQRSCIIDDVGKVTDDSLVALHQILGGGRCRVRVCGGAVPCHVEACVITSHHAPQELFGRGEVGHDRWEEMCRRMNRGIFHVPDGRAIARVEVSPAGSSSVLTPTGTFLEGLLKVDGLFAAPPALAANPPMGQSYASHELPSEEDCEAQAWVLPEDLPEEEAAPAP